MKKRLCIISGIVAILLVATVCISFFVRAPFEIENVAVEYVLYNSENDEFEKWNSEYDSEHPNERRYVYQIVIHNGNDYKLQNVYMQIYNTDNSLRGEKRPITEGLSDISKKGTAKSVPITMYIDANKTEEEAIELLKNKKADDILFISGGKEYVINGIWNY